MKKKKEKKNKFCRNNEVSSENEKLTSQEVIVERGKTVCSGSGPVGTANVLSSSPSMHLDAIPKREVSHGKEYTGR